MVSTSPALTLCPGAFSRTPLIRKGPASTRAAAEVRAFTTRACHNHLSRRWRSTRHHNLRHPRVTASPLPLEAFAVFGEPRRMTTPRDLSFEARKERAPQDD